jgi:hypothetical protein
MTSNEQLRLLSIFHYVVAGLAGLFSLFPLAYVGVGAFFLLGTFSSAGHDPGPPPAFLGWILIGVGSVMCLVGLAYVVLMIVAGRSLAQRRRYVLCMVAAASSCMFMPFGTVLGVFTILVLVKPEVQQMFGRPDVVPAAR